MTQSASRGKDSRLGTVLNIQGLRGIAAMLVVWSHVKYPIAKLCPLKLVPFFATYFGGIGVDVFFVISGFVISMTAAKRHSTAADFLLARIARVVPLYLIATLLCILFRTVAAEPLSFNSIWNGLFYLPIFDYQQFTHPPLEVGWTLSFEMWFYTAFAILMTFLTPSRAAQTLPLFFACCVFGGIWYRGEWYLPRFLLHPLVLEFSFGCMVYHFHRSIGWKISWTLVLAAVAFFLLFSVGSGYLGSDRELGPSRYEAWLRVSLWGVPAALLLAGLVGLERNGIWKMPAALVWLGEISYSLYLTHRLPQMLIAKMGGYFYLRDPYVIGAVMAVGSVLIAYMSFVCVEKPLSSGAKRLAKRLLPAANGTPIVAT
jgi:exopolysaccharide production protein ExoZ